MGAVLPAAAATGQTVYATIMDMLTGELWNGASMERYNSAHWGNYVVSMPEQVGSGRYIMTAPGGLPAGNYWVIPYIQIGVSPAVGVDTPLDIVRLGWDGGNIVDINSGLNASKIAGSATAATNLSNSAQAIVVGAVAAGTLTTTQMTTNLAATVANIYAGRILIFTNGVNVWLACLITAYAVTGGKLTFIAYENATAPSAPSVADTFIIL